MKDIQIIKSKRNPTFLRADLKHSLLPFGEFENLFRVVEENETSNQEPREEAQEEEEEEEIVQEDLDRMTSSSETIKSSQEEISQYLPSNSTSKPNENLPKPFHLTQLSPLKFDVIIIDPPLEAYEWESIPSTSEEVSKTWSWKEISDLPIPSLAAKESFIFLWVGTGSGDGLERGREILTKWGYRRCEDIVWVKTNPDRKVKGTEEGEGYMEGETNSAFSRSVQHCLMGIKGTVKRSDDNHFVHCNIDTDVILWEGEGEDVDVGDGNGYLKGEGRIDSRSKPPELYNIAENFCLGTRRLEVFGRNRNLRRGWLTIGSDLGPEGSNWRNGEPPLEDLKALENARALARDFKEKNHKNRFSEDWEDGSQTDLEFLLADETSQPLEPVEYQKESFETHFQFDLPGVELKNRSNLMPFDKEIEALRPRTPPFFNRGNGRGAGRGRGRQNDRGLPNGLGGKLESGDSSRGRGRGRNFSANNHENLNLLSFNSPSPSRPNFNLSDSDHSPSFNEESFENLGYQQEMSMPLDHQHQHQQFAFQNSPYRIQQFYPNQQSFSGNGNQGQGSQLIPQGNYQAIFDSEGNLIPFEQIQGSVGNLAMNPFSQGQRFQSQFQNQSNLNQRERHGGSGLGAGGPRVVSTPSGSETLSGPQRVVLAQQQSRGGRGRGRGLDRGGLGRGGR